MAKPWASAKDRKGKLESAGLWDDFVAMRKELKGQVQDFNEVAEERIMKLYFEKTGLSAEEDKTEEVGETPVEAEVEVEAPKKKAKPKTGKPVEAITMPTQEDLMWAFANWDVSNLKPTQAPNLNAWAFRQNFISDPASRRQFADKISKAALGEIDDSGHDPALDRSGLLEALRERFSTVRGAARRVIGKELSPVL